MVSRDLFMACIKVKEQQGRTKIDCKLGLWGVNSPDYDQAMREAYHYFSQYYTDGEYERLLKESKQ